MAAHTLAAAQNKRMNGSRHDHLLGAVATGDAHARRDLFEQHGEHVWRVLYRLSGDYDEAHDLTQETFLRAFRKAGSYDGRGSVRGWLVRIALNLGRDRMRKDRRQRQLIEAATVDSPAGAPRADPLLAERVQSAVNSLSDVQRVVLVLHDLEDYTHEEIAALLDIAPGSSRARLSRARSLLREALGELKGQGNDE